MGQANLKAKRREERVALAREREAEPVAAPDAGELPAGTELRPEQIDYWRAKVTDLQRQLVAMASRGMPDIQARIDVPAPGNVAITFASGPLSIEAHVIPRSARQLAEMILAGADRAEGEAERPPDLSAPPPGLWTPGANGGG